MAALADIESRLTTCSQALREFDPVSRERVLLLIDDLLDQRNQLVGVPKIKAKLTAACSICYQQLPIRWLDSEIAGRDPVPFFDCPTCDRRKCKCGNRVQDRKDPRCPSGHWLDR